ncbi:MAG TPA: hypothetical protein VL426_06850 [Candidatus Binatia bacterium]|nr:hypothetical protein [Candidatus Binatia bacterium]
METASTVRTNGHGESPDPPCEEIHVIVSDMHLSAGKVLQVRAKRSLRWRIVRAVKKAYKAVDPPPMREVPNPLEDFVYDDVFAAFMAKVSAQYGGAGVLRLKLMGDVFDPLAVTWGGKLVDPPFETVGVYKMRRIMRGHATFFDALAAFLKAPNARLDVFVGNHDQFLSWPRVQQEIVARVAGGDESLAAKIRFVDQSMDFEELHRGVLYDHGMNSEAHNTIDPRTTILHDRFGQPLKRPVLNKPLGSHMTMMLASRLKLRNPLIGRMPTEWDIWLHAAKHQWSWGVFAGFSLLWMLIYNQFFAFWDIRRKTGFLTVLRVVLATTKHNPVDAYATKLFRKREGVRVVVLGHSHIAKRMTGPEGTYINTGSWAMKLRFVFPSFAYTWKKFRWLEVVIRAVGHFLRTGQIAFARQLTKLLGFAAAVAAMLVFLLTSFRQNSYHLLSYDLLDLKLPVGILLVFLVVSGLFRVFAIKPDVVDDTQFTFGLVRHCADGELNADLMRYVPQEDAIRECV